MMNSGPAFQIKKIVKFSGIVLFMVLILALLNWLPSIIQKHKLKKFDSVEAARKELHIKDIYLPTYIPEHLGLAWPPAEIYAQNSPFNAVIMHFDFKDKIETGLIIHQVDARAEYRIKPRMKIRQSREGRSISVKNRTALLVPSVCDNDSPCNQLSWTEDGTVLTLIGKFTAQELIKIGASMLPGE
jgi:hypothetical protein